MVSYELLETLSNLRGVSGYEEKVASKIAQMFDKYCDEVSIDNLGNIIGIKKCNSENAKRIMLEAHMDEIGLMITDIDKNGFLYFQFILLYNNTENKKSCNQEII